MLALFSRNRAFALMVLLSGILVVGCKDGGTGGSSATDCSSDDDCTNGVCVDGSCVADGDATDGADSDPGDGTDTDMSTDLDGDEDDGDVEPDIDAGDPCLEPSDRPFECACDDDNQCSSGRCFEGLDGGVCSKLCSSDADCGGGIDYQCVESTSGGDAQKLCTPLLAELCTPCDSNANCSADAGSICFEFFDGSNCLIPCESDTNCPDEFSCVAQDGGGNVCVPDLSTCGTCFDPDFDDAGEGPGCLADDCNQDDSSIFFGAVDVCDGKDNDCDEVVDQDFVDENGNYTLDVENCGDCGYSCNNQDNNPNVLEGSCVDGGCGVVSCQDGFLDCTGELGCETATSNPNNCGGCSNADPDRDCVARSANGATNYTCEEVTDGEFECVPSACDFGFADCDGDGICEADLMNDNTCGSCVTDCDDLVNTADGLCETMGSGADTSYACDVDICDDGFCDHNPEAPGCEDPLTSTRYCGPADCSEFVDCSDPNVVRNSSGEFCADGLCDYDTCDTGYADCNLERTDGCEADVRDPSTCTDGCFDCNGLVTNPDAHVTGLVGAQCSPSNGCLFSCQVGFGNCNQMFMDGCEAPLNTIENCNACNNDCTRRFANSSGSCGGAPPLNAVDPATGCGLGVCDEGYVDLDGVVTTGCECSQEGEDLPDFDGEAGTGVDTNCDLVDGDAINAVFVSVQGADDDTCGIWGDLDGDGSTEIPLSADQTRYDLGSTEFSPNQLRAPHACKTIAKGMERAAALGFDTVLISSGTYTQPTDGLVVDAGIGLYGGYATDFRARALDSRTVLNTTTARRLVRVLGTGEDDVILSGMELRGLDLDPATKSDSSSLGEGASVYTLWVDGANAVTVADSIVAGGTGEGGENGFDGGNGAGGAGGGTGGNGRATGVECCPSAAGGGGGSGGSRTCEGTNVSGGGGGAGASVGGNSGGSGSRGSNGQNSGGSGGNGGGSGSNGNNGSAGGQGSNGAAGAGGSDSDGTWSGSEYVGENGANGAPGSHGRGGGGGGGGGGESTCIICGVSASGGGGGGGGSGGCRGAAGERGFAAGGSIAVVIIAGSVELEDSVVRLGRGGNGGAGGDGGDGGSGGEKGTKGAGSGGGIDEDGGAGGDGGSGGAGGGAGGGGGACGGAAIGIASINGGSWTDTGVTFETCGAANCGGAGGAGGAGGRLGGSGTQAPNGANGCRGAAENSVEY